jgi:hypothetical protein
MAGGSGNQLLDTGLMIAAGVAAPELALAIAPEMMGAGAVSAGLATGLSGAALSGGVAAATGQDVGKAALMGGIGGGLGGYLQGADAAGSGITAGSQGAPIEFSQAENAAGLSQGIPQAVPQVSASNLVDQVGMTPQDALQANSGIAGQAGDQAVSNLGQNSAYSQTAPTGSNPSSAWNQAGSGKGMWSSLSPLEKAQVIGAGTLGANALLSPPNIGLPQSTSPNVPKGLQFHFNEDPNAMYQPSFAPNYNGIAGINTGPRAQRPIGYADGGTVEQMSRENAIGGNQMFPQSGLGGLTGMNTYQNATNTPTGTDVIEPTDAITDPYTGAMKFAVGGMTPTSSTQSAQKNTAFNLPAIKQYMSIASTPTGMKQVSMLAQQGDYNAQFALNKLQGGDVQGVDSASQVPVQAAQGGIMGYAKGGDLGSYSDGGRMLKGPGDGMSDSIPAKIGHHQPARLADSEFVIPADVVSHLGNGSSDAGAKQLYAMMDRVRKARTGRKEQGKQIKPQKYLPA